MRDLKMDRLVFMDSRPVSVRILCYELGQSVLEAKQMIAAFVRLHETKLHVLYAVSGKVVQDGQTVFCLKKRAAKTLGKQDLQS